MSVNDFDSLQSEDVAGETKYFVTAHMCPERSGYALRV